LHEHEQRALRAAIGQLKKVFGERRRVLKAQRRVQVARKFISKAHAALGSGLEMHMGEGTLLF
jgi:hypothetical protein